MRVIFFLLLFPINLWTMTGKQVIKELLPYLTLNAQDSVSVLRFTKSNAPKIIVGTKSVNNEYINSLMYIFDTDGKMVGTITNPDEVNCLDTSATNETEYVSDCGKSVKIWDLEKMKLKAEFAAVEDNFSIVSLEYNKEANQILCAEDTMVKIWDCRAKEFVQEFNAHTAEIDCACWSPDDQHIATVSADRTIKLWDSRTGGLVKMETRPSSKTFKLPESKSEEAVEKERHSTRRSTIAFNSNNDLICADLYLYVYESGLGFSKAFNFDGKEAQIRGSTIGLANNSTMPQARSVTFIPRNSDYVIAGINDGTVCICNQSDTSQSIKIKTLANNFIMDDAGKALGVSPDGKILAVGSFLEQSVRLWKLEELIANNGSSRSIKSVESEKSSTTTPKPSTGCCIIN